MSQRDDSSNYAVQLFRLKILEAFASVPCTVCTAASWCECGHCISLVRVAAQPRGVAPPGLHDVCYPAILFLASVFKPWIFESVYTHDRPRPATAGPEGLGFV